MSKFAELEIFRFYRTAQQHAYLKYLGAHHFNLCNRVSVKIPIDWELNKKWWLSGVKNQ
jgi:hypothetical protein